jgi:hypothetical protein
MYNNSIQQTYKSNYRSLSFRAERNPLLRFTSPQAAFPFIQSTLRVIIANLYLKKDELLSPSFFKFSREIEMALPWSIITNL